MADFETALHSELSSLDLEVHPLAAPEGSPIPYVVYQTSDGVNERSLDEHLPLRAVPCELIVVTSSYADLRAKSDAIKSKVLSFQGRVIGSGGPYVQSLSYDSPIDNYNEETKQYEAFISLTVFHQ